MYFSEYYRTDHDCNRYIYLAHAEVDKEELEKEACTYPSSEELPVKRTKLTSWQHYLKEFGDTDGKCITGLGIRLC